MLWVLSLLSAFPALATPVASLAAVDLKNMYGLVFEKPWKLTQAQVMALISAQADLAAHVAVDDARTVVMPDWHSLQASNPAVRVQRRMKQRQAQERAEESAQQAAAPAARDVCALRPPAPQPRPFLLTGGLRLHGLTPSPPAPTPSLVIK